MTEIEQGIKSMAKWAAAQPDPARAGAEFACMLGYASRISEMDDDAKRWAEERIAQWRAEPVALTTESLASLNNDIAAHFGWER